MTTQLVITLLQVVLVAGMTLLTAGLGWDMCREGLRDRDISSLLMGAAMWCFAALCGVGTFAGIMVATGG